MPPIPSFDEDFDAYLYKNSSLARAKSKNFVNHFYISPQLWAWKENRIKTIRKVIDQMFVILPFEKEYYKKLKYDVVYVGHPNFTL